MDRTPAWLGIYRFLYEGRALAEVLREIEQHRGYRPKASVTCCTTTPSASEPRSATVADPTGRPPDPQRRGQPDAL